MPKIAAIIIALIVCLAVRSAKGQETYSEVLDRAKREKKPLVVGYGCKPVVPAGYLGFHAATTGKPHLMVTTPTQRDYAMAFACDVSPEEIVRWVDSGHLERRVSQGAPPFASRSSDNDNRSSSRRETADADSSATGPWLPESEQRRLAALWPGLPEGARFFRATQFTQYAAHNNSPFVMAWSKNHDHPFYMQAPALNPNRMFPYRVPGGLDHVPGHEWSSNFWALIPKGERIVVWEEQARVSNAPYGWLPQKRKSFPDGTKFGDLLLNKYGEPFEGRVRTKEPDGDFPWASRLAFSHEENKPPGYVGHLQSGRSCAGCHDNRELPVYFINVRRDDGAFSASCFKEGTLEWDFDNWPLVRR